MRRSLLILPAIAGIVVLLSGCMPGRTDGGLIGIESESPAAEVSRTPVPTPAATAEPDASPTAAPSPASLVAPECDAIASLDWMHQNLDDEIDEPVENVDEFSPESLPGPAAQRAAAGSDPLGSCTWGIPGSDGAFTVSFLAIPPNERTTLITALESSPTYTRREDGYVADDGRPAPTYSHLFEEGIGYGLAYSFHGGFWVSVAGTMISPDDAVELSSMALDAAISDS
ncbi:hypothetical protein KZX37_12930 [Microbacterium sp. EYE_5]|uniref:hypothetical protein n=1 Tax=unclassified Microbacterium TaxID=2609290 RepID=UPI00200310C7|nr:MULTISPECIES: hypothetical protein [unclassified Microbacterium]MCK6080587.1 hypothetical protein [Microbacterium sp. EYE_382]MCK6085858.1 hypothetical protein [Microbacterium sp. EYE_384]MCK6124644.1 hypothetical protein [Microbacterium sp. EYE_80]MCK6127553.1 hypothetical protein [Microbacterium sp. EYE_79]MCK6141542.1 hypothetical protein [Microbacterium sp. EYE_39]